MSGVLVEVGVVQMVVYMVEVYSLVGLSVGLVMAVLWMVVGGVRGGVGVPGSPGSSCGLQPAGSGRSWPPQPPASPSPAARPPPGPASSPGPAVGP